MQYHSFHPIFFSFRPLGHLKKRHLPSPELNGRKKKRHMENRFNFPTDDGDLSDPHVGQSHHSRKQHQNINANANSRKIQQQMENILGIYYSDSSESDVSEDDN